MAENGAAKRCPTRHDGQTCRFCQRLNADDRIVPPEITFLLGPPGDAVTKDRTVERGRKLLGTRKQRLCTDQLRNSLD